MGRGGGQDKQMTYTNLASEAAFSIAASSAAILAAAASSACFLTWCDGSTAQHKKKIEAKKWECDASVSKE